MRYQDRTLNVRVLDQSVGDPFRDAVKGVHKNLF